MEFALSIDILPSDGILRCGTWSEEEGRPEVLPGRQQEDTRIGRDAITPGQAVSAHSIGGSGVCCGAGRGSVCTVFMAALSAPRLQSLLLVAGTPLLTVYQHLIVAIQSKVFRWTDPTIQKV
ncbi:unnamed protein product [Nezara viridula]|uniref:Uncharacterized protein n=1 Tax=Nezara viridula TaxID=85310 RepID=A0A9P0H3A0_NEZVI|nr:unnamed protein product [Nezara viridula]